MTTKLIKTSDGEVLAEDLTIAELRALESAGVTLVPDEDGDIPGGSGGDAPDEDEVPDKLVDSDPQGSGDGTSPEEETDEETDISTDEVADALEAMDEQNHEDSGDWWDASDYEEPSQTDLDRLQDLKDRLAESKTDLAAAKGRRDERSQEGRGYWSSDEIRRRIENDDLVDDLTEALRELKTRDRDLPAESGHSLYIDAVVRKKAGAFGERDLYLHREQAEMGDRAVSVALDLSGSMDEDKAKTALAALAEATEVIGDDFSAIGYYDRSTVGIQTPLITAPGEEFEYYHLDSFGTRGGTPTADGIQAAAGYVADADKPEKLVICITDGKANSALSSGYVTGDAKEDARHVIHAARGDDVKVIGLGIAGASDGYMQSVFGDDYVTADADDLVEALVEVYRRQLNTTGGRY